MLTMNVLMSHPAQAASIFRLLRNYDYVREVIVDYENKKVYFDVDESCPDQLELLYTMEETMIKKGYSLAFSPADNRHLEPKYYGSGKAPVFRSNIEE